MQNLKVRSLHLRDEEELTEYEAYGLLPTDEKWKAGGIAAMRAVREYWASGDYMPAALVPLAKKLMAGGKGTDMPSKKTLGDFNKAAGMILRKEVKTAGEASLAVGRKEKWFAGTKVRYPGLWKNIEREYYRDLEESVELAKWEAKQKRIQATSELADLAADRHRHILTDNDVAPAVQMTAVKHVDDVLGVVGKRGAERAAQQWMPTEQEKALLARSEIVLDAEVIDGPTGPDVP